MQGVEILSIDEIKYTQDWIVSLMVASLVLALIFLIGAYLTEHIVFAIGMIICLLTWIASMGLIISDKITEYDHTEYKVTISDEVSFLDFNEKYEIVSQDGKIYTVRER